MAESTVWWLLTGAMVALELITGTFYLLMLALGMAAAAIAAHLGAGFTGQLVAAAAVGGGAVAVWYKVRARTKTLPARADRDVNLDIGQSLHIEHWAADGTAQVRYRGSTWTVALMPGYKPESAAAGQYRIEQVIGSRLMVVPSP